MNTKHGSRCAERPTLWMPGRRCIQGVDALGFIFVEKSPRYIPAQKAGEVVCLSAAFVDRVGVFIDRDVQEVLEIILEVGLTYAQLHGGEDPSYCRQIARMAAPCKVIKAFRVGLENQAADFARYNDVVCGFLLDTYIKRAGRREPGRSSIGVSLRVLICKGR